MTGLSAADVVLHADAQGDFAVLAERGDKAARTILAKARALRPVLLKDCLHGAVVKKARAPKALATRYHLESLYIKDLPDFWRMLYTIQKVAGERYVVVLRIVDHATYDRWFPGRGR